MKYADYNAAITDRFNIVTYYDDVIHGGRMADGGKIPDGAIEIAEEEWQASIDNPGKYWVNPVTKTFEQAPAPAPAEQLAAAQAAKVATLYAAAKTAITSGEYTSSVLGTPHHYGLSTASTLERTAVVASARRHEAQGGWSRKLWCTPDGAPRPRRIVHTATQIQDLSDEINDWIDSQYDHLDDLLVQVETVAGDLDTALTALADITW